jgi:AmmeMemoRadiSam system protein A
VSSDLSHYYDYATARRLDAATTRAIVSLDPASLGAESACGRVPLRGLLAVAKRRGLAVETVDVRNSGDTAGPRDQVVGYGSWLFREPDGDAILLGVARRAIAAERELDIDPGDYPSALLERRSTFVTLRLDGELRGCIGSLVAELPLVQDVARSAFRAARRDPRFEPVRAAEIERLEVHVSILDPSEPLAVESEEELLALLRPGVDGLVLVDGDRRATFLPDVWEALPDPRDFVARLKEKAGLAVDHWSPRIRVSRYTTRTIS